MALNKTQHRIYDYIISTLAVISVIFIFMDYGNDLYGWKLLLYRIIYFVFLADFITRFFSTENKKKFLMQNYTDLIALIPFHGIFYFPFSAAADKLFRILNLVRVFGFLSRPLRKATRFLNTNGFKYVLFITFLTILSGGILIHFAEGMSIEDGIWWAFVTSTTVGYGDISPQTFYGKLIAVVLMLVGIGLLGSVTSTVTSFFLTRQNLSVKNKTLEMIQDQLNHFDDLSNKDIDEICRLLKALK